VAKTFFNGMRIIIYLILPALMLAVGFISGVAGERYWRREECLRLAFDNADAPNLSDQEIGDILKTLNAGEESIFSATDQSGLNYVGTSVDTDSPTGAAASEPVKRNFVGSRNSNKFYALDCRYAKRIKEENKVYFASREEGEEQGRTYVECK